MTTRHISAFAGSSLTHGWLHFLSNPLPRAHFYLAILDIINEGSVNLPQAALEFKAEMATYPDDYQINL